MNLSGPYCLQCYPIHWPRKTNCSSHSPLQSGMSLILTWGISTALPLSAYQPSQRLGSVSDVEGLVFPWSTQYRVKKETTLVVRNFISFLTQKPNHSHKQTPFGCTAARAHLPLQLLIPRQPDTLCSELQLGCLVFSLKGSVWPGVKKWCYL